MREVDDELGRLLLIHGTDRDRGRHAPIPPIPQRDARLRGVSLDLHRRLTRLTLRNGHQRHAVGVRGEDRLPELQRDTVPGEHLIKLEGVIRPRQAEALELRHHRRLPNRLRPPPEVELRVPQLRRKSEPEILERLLRVEVQRALLVLVQPGPPHLKGLADHWQLGVADILDPKIGDIVRGPHHKNACLRFGFRLVVLAPYSASVAASSRVTDSPSREASQPNPPFAPILRRIADFACPSSSA